MANDYSGYNSGNGFAGFNYNSEAERIKRQRAVADRLAAMSQQPTQPAYVSNAMGTFYSGGNGTLSAASQLAAALLASKEYGETKDSQRDLDKTSAEALAYYLDPANQPRSTKVAEQALNEESLGERGTVETAPREELKTFPLRMPVLESRPLVEASSPPKQDLQAPITNRSGLTPQQMEAAAALQAAGQRRGSSGSLRRNAYVAGGSVAEPPRQGNGGATGSWDEPLAPPPPPEPMARAAAAALSPNPAPVPTPEPAAPQNPVAPVAAIAPTQPAQPAAPQPSPADQIKQLIAIANTGPLGQQIATAQMNSMFGSKNGRFSTSIHADPVNGGFVAVTTDSASGRMSYQPINAGGGNEKVLETKVSADGTLLERTSKGWRPAQMQGGGAVMTNEGQQQQAKETDAKSAEIKNIESMKDQLARMEDMVPLIQKVGTGRLQTPWNNFKAYFTNSDDLDKMNRGFSAQQLEGAVTWLKGQGSVTDAERKLLAASQFDPKGSTASNIEYANIVIGMLRKHIPLAEATYNAKYGSTTSEAPPSGGFMYSWQKK